jgi:Ala-tRNA(Pro) deacylase
MGAERVREYLLSHGVAYEMTEHPLAYTAQRVAESEHISGKSIAKPVILLADEQFVMAVIPGHKHVDLNKARVVLGCAEVRMAREDEFAAAFGDCEAGAEPPLGSLYEMRTILDSRLTDERITFRGGSHTQTITMALQDYRAIVGPQVVDIAAGT